MRLISWICLRGSETTSNYNYIIIVILEIRDYSLGTKNVILEKIFTEL
jgi:hypothetical protein